MTALVLFTFWMVFSDIRNLSPTRNSAKSRGAMNILHFKLFKKKFLQENNILRKILAAAPTFGVMKKNIKYSLDWSKCFPHHFHTFILKSVWHILRSRRNRNVELFEHFHLFYILNSLRNSFRGHLYLTSNYNSKFDVCTLFSKIKIRIFGTFFAFALFLGVEALI